MNIPTPTTTHPGSGSVGSPLAPRRGFPAGSLTGIARDPSDRVPPRPDVTLADAVVRWCGYCDAMRLSHYENLGVRCAACGCATQKVTTEIKNIMIDEMIDHLTPDEARELCRLALKRLWTEPGAAPKPDRSLIAEQVQRLLGHMR